jgi:hypothetical protein
MVTFRARRQEAVQLDVLPIPILLSDLGACHQDFTREEDAEVAALFDSV